VKFHTNVFEDPQNDKNFYRKLWNFKIVKQKTFKVHKKKGKYPLVKLHTIFLKTHRMTRKIEDSETSK
jgi:hypothetical protein